jgi:DNA polymerase III alpha subunit
LRSVYGIPEKFLKWIEEERGLRGSYRGMDDFIRRCPMIPKSALLKLATAGAFSCFHENARHLLWQIESLSLDQNSFLWGKAKENFSPAQSHEEADLIPFESNWELMVRETEAKGFSIDHHPMQVLRPLVQEWNERYRQQKYIPFLSSKELSLVRHKQKIRVVGLRSVTQRPPTAKGMCFITLEDEFGFMNLVIPPDVYQRDRTTIYNSSFLHVCGFLEKNGPVLNVKVERLFPFFDPKTSFDNVNTGVPS